jgi:hypothetical protein
MFRKRIPFALIGLAFLLIGLSIAVGYQPKPGELTGWTIIRTPDGLRCTYRWIGRLLWIERGRGLPIVLRPWTCSTQRSRPKRFAP